MALAVITLGSLTGCYSFVPTTSTALPERTPVSVHLTLGGTVALQPTLGAGVAELDGTVLHSTPDSLVIAVEDMYTTGRQKFESSGTTTSIPRPYIESVKVRTFSRKRTTLTLIGALVLAIAGAAGVSAGSASGGGGDGGGVIPP